MYKINILKLQAKPAEHSLSRRKKKHSPTPNIGSIFNPIPLFHPLGDSDVLGTMVSANPARYAVDENVFEEERQNGSCSLVVIGTNACHKAGIAVHESVDNDMPSSQACSTKSPQAGQNKL
jgi:hypothetical protein